MVILTSQAVAQDRHRRCNRLCRRLCANIKLFRRIPGLIH
jgi:hypothetical protein